jgi:hypothetical protein
MKDEQMHFSPMRFFAYLHLTKKLQLGFTRRNQNYDLDLSASSFFFFFCLNVHIFRDNLWDRNQPVHVHLFYPFPYFHLFLFRCDLSTEVSPSRGQPESGLLQLHRRSRSHTAERIVQKADVERPSRKQLLNHSKEEKISEMQN